MENLKFGKGREGEKGNRRMKESRREERMKKLEKKEERKGNVQCYRKNIIGPTVQEVCQLLTLAWFITPLTWHHQRH